MCLQGNHPHTLLDSQDSPAPGAWGTLCEQDQNWGLAFSRCTSRDLDRDVGQVYLEQ